MARTVAVVIAVAVAAGGLTAPFAATAWAAPRLVAWAGSAIGVAASEILPSLPRAASVDPPSLNVSRADDVARLDEGERVSARLRDPLRARGTSRASPHALHVSAAEVLRVARAGVVPAGEPVAATAARPAGLALRGVGAMGVGLRDGDVLGEVSGVAATSVEAVVGVVVAARKRHLAALSGRVWRGDVPWELTVEMPYPG